MNCGRCCPNIVACCVLLDSVPAFPLLFCEKRLDWGLIFIAASCGMLVADMSDATVLSVRVVSFQSSPVLWLTRAR